VQSVTFVDRAMPASFESLYAALASDPSLGPCGGHALLLQRYRKWDAAGVAAIAGRGDGSRYAQVS
ncbi:hypothetical protein HaLaN_31125, partial [Haematococcus lacustris]